MSTFTAQGPFADVPLATLFPGVAAADMTRLRDAAAALDSARPPGDAPRWHWSTEHAVFPGPTKWGTLVIACTAVAIDNRPGDWTELEIDVCWTPHGLLEVTAQVGVGCFCDTNHNTHYIDGQDFTVAGGRSLAMAFEQAAQQVVSWTSGPSDPNFWRAKAGLPGPTK